MVVTLAQAILEIDKRWKRCWNLPASRTSRAGWKQFKLARKAAKKQSSAFRKMIAYGIDSPWSDLTRYLAKGNNFQAYTAQISGIFSYFRLSAFQYSRLWTQSSRIVHIIEFNRRQCCHLVSPPRCFVVIKMDLCVSLV